MVPKRTMTLIVGLALSSLFVAACGLTQPTPRIIEHARPKLTVDADIFRTTSPTKRCYSSDLYGGLQPNYPAAYCFIDWVPGNQCLRESGGFIRACEQVVVYLDGKFQFVGTREELRTLFAPIESADEALSYALLASGYSAKYVPEDYRLSVPDSCDPGPEHYRYYTDVLEDTHVVEVANAYEVKLFQSQEFGCAPHPVWLVTVRVNYDGRLSESPKIKLFEEDLRGPGKVVNCCID